MKIRFYKNLVVFFDVLFGILLLLLTSLAYFLGFPININTLPYYFISLFSIFSLVFIIYIVYFLICRTFIIFTNEGIIKEKNGKQDLLIRYRDILYVNYYNIFTLLIGDAKGGNLVIEFMNENKEISYIYLSISKKNIILLKKRGYLKQYSIK